MANREAVFAVLEILKKYDNPKGLTHNQIMEYLENDYDIKFGTEPVIKFQYDDEQEEYVEENTQVESVDEQDVDNVEQADVAEVQPKVQPRDVQESVSSTRQTASASLEELMKMMEEEQKKLKEQLKQ